MITPHVYDIPLTVLFRGITHRTGIVFEGPAGWAEWSPFPDYSDAECVSWLRAALEAASEGYPAAVRDAVEVNGIVPAIAPEDAAARAVASGCQTIKIKVAGESTLDDDLDRVLAVRAALPEARIRVDANGGWSLAEAKEAVRQLGRLRLEYVEQPCATVDELAALRRMDLGVPIAADESIRRAEDPYRVRDAGAADIAVLKVQPLGGVRACLRIADQIGMPVVVSSAVETSVGLSAGLALAAALPDLPYACGLETARLLDGDLTADTLAPVDGVLAVRAPAVDPHLLAEHAADSSTTDSWLSRLRRVVAMVGRS